MDSEIITGPRGSATVTVRIAQSTPGRVWWEIAVTTLSGRAIVHHRDTLAAARRCARAATGAVEGEGTHV